MCTYIVQILSIYLKRLRLRFSTLVTMTMTMTMVTVNPDRKSDDRFMIFSFVIITNIFYK